MALVVHIVVKGWYNSRSIPPKLKHVIMNWNWDGSLGSGMPFHNKHCARPDTSVRGGTTAVVIKHSMHDDVIKWKHFPHYWPFVWGIHRSPVNSRHKGQWRGDLVFSLICAWINGRVNNGEAGVLRRCRLHVDFTVIWPLLKWEMHN